MWISDQEWIEALRKWGIPARKMGVPHGTLAGWFFLRGKIHLENPPRMRIYYRKAYNWTTATIQSPGPFFYDEEGDDFILLSTPSLQRVGSKACF